MRLFLAINLDPTVRRAIIESSGALRSAAPTLNWVDESKLHLTLKFLGEQPETVVDPLKAVLDDVALRHRSFSIGIAGVGAFPNFRRARVVWVGVEQEPRLELLHHDVEMACEPLGFEVEARPFRPHLTLARVRDRTPLSELRTLSRTSKRLELNEETEVMSIDLMRSTGGGVGSGSKYERLHAAPLRAN